VYERFTDRARKVMQLANQEAQRFNHEYVGTEHLLLGLVKEGSGVAANILKHLGIDLPRVHVEVENIIQSGPDRPRTGRLPNTPRAKQVIENSISEASDLHHNYVGTEHLLLGLLSDWESVAAQVLINLGLNLTDVRAEVLNLLGHPSPAAGSQPTFEAVISEDTRAEVRCLTTEWDSEIDRLRLEKEEAVAEGDFERAAHLRDQADRLKKQRKAHLLRWPAMHPIDPSWLAWSGGTAARIVQEINESRHWQDLQVLADALEDAGCADAEILCHFRETRLHLRRCWVLDLLLGELPSPPGRATPPR
jgi:ATP-dependent Clp protease ATP-binding subunit ClpA